jgi:isoleucyl-tRNA synthetase
MLSRLYQVVERATVCMDDYDPYGATLAIEPLLDDLTNWYVRRSRRRFWKSEHDADKEAAYATLYRVLLTLCKLLAPLVPFVTEVMYQNLARSVALGEGAEAGAGEPCASVHHCAWPTATDDEGLGLVDEDLLERMALAMQLAALGRSARSTSGVKLRQPLARARVYVGAGAGAGLRPEAQPEGSSRLGSLTDLVIDELNVKDLEFVDREADLVEYEIGLLPNVLGPKHGRRFPLLRQAVAAADANALARRFQAGLPVTVELADDGPPVELLPEEVEVRSHGREGYAVAEERDTIVAVDVTLTPELVREGLARDLVRRIQTLRKDADFQLDDRIVTFYDANDEVRAVFEEWGDYIRSETLSLELVPGPLPADTAQSESLRLGEHEVMVGVRKA